MFLADHLFVKETTSRETCGYEVDEECLLRIISLHERDDFK